MRKWYVGDQHDNFDEFDSVTEAADLAGCLALQGFEGVYMLHLTKEEFEAMCKIGYHKPSTK